MLSRYSPAAAALGALLVSPPATAQVGPPILPRIQQPVQDALPSPAQPELTRDTEQPAAPRRTPLLRDRLLGQVGAQRENLIANSDALASVRSMDGELGTIWIAIWIGYESTYREQHLSILNPNDQDLTLRARCYNWAALAHSSDVTMPANTVWSAMNFGLDQQTDIHVVWCRITSSLPTYVYFSVEVPAAHVSTRATMRPAVRVR